MRNEMKNFGWIFVIIVGIFVLSSSVLGQAQVVYVDDDAGGASNGTSWVDAFTTLQDALAAVQAGDEIWVGQGIYTPDKGGGNIPGDREASFGLVNGVLIYGGYAGVGVGDPNDRDPDVYISILSGDISGDDDAELFGLWPAIILEGIGKYFNTLAPNSPYDQDSDEDIDFDDVLTLLDTYHYIENSMHVVTVGPKVNGAVLDGFVIKGGSTHSLMGNNPESGGGGLVNAFGGLTINDCVFSNNFSFQYPEYSSMQSGGSGAGLAESDYSHHASLGVGGGGIHTYGGEPVLTSCTFKGNVCWGGDGGGIYNDSYGLDLSSCSFETNLAMKVHGGDNYFFGGLGGGLYNGAGGVTLNEGIFVENRSSVNGGGVYNTAEGFSGITSFFQGNVTGDKGGGFYNGGENLLLRNSVFVTNTAIRGSGLYSWSEQLILDECRVDGLAGYLGTNSRIALGGEGSVTITEEVALVGNAEVTGGGEILVKLGGKLYLEDMVTVDLEWGGNNGKIECDGFLRGAGQIAVSNADLTVRHSKFIDQAQITNCIIRTHEGLSVGPFLIRDGVTVTGNEIHAQGDWYLNLNPATFYGVVSDNKIYVTIPEILRVGDGGLLELRGQDDLLDTYIPDPDNPYFCQVPPGTLPVFEPNSWSLEELRLEDYAKTWLVNRFDYQYPYDQDGKDEVLYVKDFIIGEHAILNTSFNRIYYENLEIAPTAKVLNMNLSALSLGTISYDIIQEYLTLVETNNFTNVNQPVYDRIHVERVERLLPDPCGMMQMINLKDEDPASSTFGEVFRARSKHNFAATSENKVVIHFEYLFGNNDPNTELVIYLSDIADLLPTDDEGRYSHYQEVGRLRPPPLGRPGAYGSERFGIFQVEIYPKFSDLSEGVWLEYELFGPPVTGQFDQIRIDQESAGEEAGYHILDTPGSTVYTGSSSVVVLCDPMQLYCKDVSGD
ncbi:MAG: hypothetical protein GY869_30645, partial [Planctomycetes bacterium]|nr:hypothetical protein [Planctomycetota bacterium]